jgi:hypothetical protein
MKRAELRILFLGDIRSRVVRKFKHGNEIYEEIRKIFLTENTHILKSVLGF